MTSLGSRSTDEPYNILLVEDNPDTLYYLDAVLKRRGHNITGVSTLSAARDQCQIRSFDLLLSDIELPDGSGLDLMREFANGGAPGIAISGFGSEEDIRMSKAAGFSAHLTKPINIRRLEALIAKALSRTDSTIEQTD